MNFEVAKGENEPEKIVRKALRLGDKMYVADNHVLAYDQLVADNPDFNADEELHKVDYGFITNKGNFVYNDEKDKYLDK